MIKILIVDDEEIERKAMRKMLTRGIEEAEAAGEAANGRKAIELARELEPDIIMMDIKMPGIDGVEAVKTIKKERPDTKFVMVTAFDTFEYAREVMKEGVKEYLLKPSKKSDIIETVYRVIKEIKAERNVRQEQLQLQEKLERARSFAGSEWVASLLLDHVGEIDMNEWNTYLDLDIQTAYAVVFRFYHQKGEWSHEQRTEHYRWVKRDFEEKAECLVGPMSGNQIPVLVSIGELRRRGEITIQSDAVQHVKELIEGFGKYFAGVTIKAGVGTPVESPDQFIDSYNEALIALEQTSDQVPYLYYHPSLTGKNNDFILYKKEKKLLEAMKEGDRDTMLAAFEAYFHDLADSANGKVTRTEQRLQELWAVIARMTEEMGIEFKLSYSQPETSTLNQLRELAKVRLLQAAARMDEWRSNDMHGLLHQGKEFVRNHFDKAVSLEEVSSEIGLSPYYFSKLFKESQGMTFVEYLTKLRMGEAKKLLRTARLSQKEICFQVGYRDPNYFSRVFKKMNGISPSEYRTKHRL
jgi:two-component system response regulator YesN